MRYRRFGLLLMMRSVLGLPSFRSNLARTFRAIFSAFRFPPAEESLILLYSPVPFQMTCT